MMITNKLYLIVVTSLLLHKITQQSCGLFIWNLLKQIPYNSKLDYLSLSPKSNIYGQGAEPTRVETLSRASVINILEA
jgi:hypothetical protein